MRTCCAAGVSLLLGYRVGRHKARAPRLWKVCNTTNTTWMQGQQQRSLIRQPNPGRLLLLWIRAWLPLL